MHYVSDIATDPNLTPVYQRGKQGSLYTKTGKPSKYYVEDIREGVKIRVVVEPAGDGIITAFPVK